MNPKLSICSILLSLTTFISINNAKYHPYNGKIGIECQTEDGIIFLRIDEMIIDDKKLDWKQLDYNASSCTSSEKIIENKTPTNIEKLELKFETDIGMDFEFLKIKNNTYEMKKITIILNETLYEKDEFDLRYNHKFKIDTQGYHCDDLINYLKINKTVPNVKDEISVQFKQFQFAAYLSHENVTNIAFKECNPLPGNQLVPILVGSGLLVLMGVCLTIYIFMRSR